MKFRERLYAFLLASVFMPMLLLAPFHSHEEHQNRPADDCECCINHTPHDGHISDESPIPQCVLCNFVWAQYLPQQKCQLTDFEVWVCEFIQTSENFYILQSPLVKSPRAPPVSFC